MTRDQGASHDRQWFPPSSGAGTHLQGGGGRALPGGGGSLLVPCRAGGSGGGPLLVPCRAGGSGRSWAVAALSVSASVATWPPFPTPCVSWSLIGTPVLGFRAHLETQDLITLPTDFPHKVTFTGLGTRMWTHFILGATVLPTPDGVLQKRVRLGALDTEALWTGPGPLSIWWLSSRSRESGFGGDALTSEHGRDVGKYFRAASAGRGMRGECVLGGHTDTARPVHAMSA